jgi:tRNA(fMet)-specific endonuclease VapC
MDIKFLLDTSVLIPLRDGDNATNDALAALEGSFCTSAVVQVELEGGVARDSAEVELRRLMLDNLLSGLEVLPFDQKCAETYGKIVVTAGYSRRKILDRMIAAQALVAEATLVTLNPEDFCDIPGLKVHSL